MTTKQLNQIILCSSLEHRSFLREVQIISGTAIVTHVERLPFRFHELLAKTPVQNDTINELDRFPVVPERHKSCPYCGNRTTYWCSCGTVSCKIVGARTHFCPGCKAEHTSAPAKTSYASESGFVENRLATRTTAANEDRQRLNTWRQSQSALFRFLDKRT